ncbi:MAG: T9SS type A sorting domain-containing protein [Candidatus Kapabacteria bacterium]|nr:T9SS type A sorting domain-containing protein [Candidatus Kapabacteria bacterium]
MNAPEVMFTWEYDGTGASFDVHVSTSADFTTLIAQGQSNETSFRFHGEKGIQYYWRVRAKSGDEASTWSSSSAFMILYAQPSAPTLIYPMMGTVNVPVTPSLRWKSVAGTMYQVQVSRSNSFDVVLVNINVPTAGNVSEVMVGGLDYATTYFWRVRGQKSGAYSVWSSVYEFSTVQQALAAPVQVNPPSRALLAFSASQSLEWQAAENANGYDLDVAVDEDFTNIITSVEGITETSYLYKGIQDNTQYFWRVRTANGLTKSVWSTSSFIVGNLLQTNTPRSPKLALPVNGMANTTTNLDLVWQPIDNASGYDVEVSPTPQFYTVVYRISVSETKTTVKNLSSGLQYFWRVRAKNEHGAGSWAIANSFTTGTTPFSPMLHYPAAEAVNIPTKARLNWNATQNATAYHIQISTNSTFTALLVDKTITTTVYDAELPEDKVLFWRVSAVNEIGEGTWSPWRFFRTAAENNVTSVEEFDLGVSDFSVSPNPGETFVRIKYTVPAKGHVIVTMMDMMARTVATIVDADQFVGSYEIPFSATMLEAGIYNVNIQLNGFVKTQKLVIVR